MVRSDWFNRACRWKWVLFVEVLGGIPCVVGGWVSGGSREGVMVNDV